jgi:hypothetical protein
MKSRRRIRSPRGRLSILPSRLKSKQTEKGAGAIVRERQQGEIPDGAINGVKRVR